MIYINIFINSYNLLQSRQKYCNKIPRQANEILYIVYKIDFLQTELIKFGLV